MAQARRFTAIRLLGCKRITSAPMTNCLGDFALKFQSGREIIVRVDVVGLVAQPAEVVIASSRRPRSASTMPISLSASALRGWMFTAS